MAEVMQFYSDRLNPLTLSISSHLDMQMETFFYFYSFMAFYVIKMFHLCLGNEHRLGLELKIVIWIKEGQNLNQRWDRNFFLGSKQKCALKATCYLMQYKYVCFFILLAEVCFCINWQKQYKKGLILTYDQECTCKRFNLFLIFLWNHSWVTLICQLKSELQGEKNTKKKKNKPAWQHPAAFITGIISDLQFITANHLSLVALVWVSVSSQMLKLNTMLSMWVAS